MRPCGLYPLRYSTTSNGEIASIPPDDVIRRCGPLAFSVEDTLYTISVGLGLGEADRDWWHQMVGIAWMRLADAEYAPRPLRAWRRRVLRVRERDQQKTIRQAERIVSRAFAKGAAL